MSVHQRKIIRTFHRLNEENETQPFDDPTDGLGIIEHIEPSDTGGTLWVYWSVPV